MICVPDCFRLMGTVKWTKMRPMKHTPPNSTAEQHFREIRRKTRKQYSSEEKIRIVISGLRGEHSIAELCRLFAVSAHRTV